MPFDPVPRSRPSIDRIGRHRVVVAFWLFALCAMLFVMVVLGGATRLTGSGLSIMEWAPLSGVLPPLRHAEWERLFALYKTIPQYALLHAGMGLAGFQGLFWLEWVHRLWGRLLGAALLLPLLWFVWRGAIDRRLALRLGLLFALGGLQGAVGWFMVASGFRADSTAVSAYRLVAHLSLALALYAALLWTALSVLHPARRTQLPRRLGRALGVLCGCVALTIAAGGFTAGLHAGLDYNTFPLMDGRLVPAGYAALTPFARNLFENVAAVQFDHRLLATVTALLAIAVVEIGWRLTRPGDPLRPGLAALAAAVLAQYALGVATLLYAVPIPLAIAHQANAVLLLTAALVCLHLASRIHTPRQETS
jgi:cytochrome c oxidase assembly protein subunit 15